MKPRRNINYMSFISHSWHVEPLYISPKPLLTLMRGHASRKRDLVFRNPSVCSWIGSCSIPLRRGFIVNNPFSNRNAKYYSTNVTCNAKWREHVGLILEAINACDFVALDIEYTGLHLKDDRYVGVDRCYEAHSSGAKQFIPCQIGLALAKHVDSGIWKITPSSLYILPPENHTFSFNTNTLSFLKENDFDFNAWIHNGVGYLKPKDEMERKGCIEARISELEISNQQTMNQTASQPARQFDIGTIPDEEDRIMALQVIQRIEEWINSDTGEPLEIAMESPFHRLLMHTIIEQQFPSVYSHSITRGNSKFLSIYKSHAELYQQQMISLKKELDILDEKVGLRLILDAIATNKKLLVGHNCFYDVLHIYQTFYDDLPTKVEEFKNKWNEKFPYVFDTKYIAECQDTAAYSNNSGTLKTLFDHLCNQELASNGKNRTRFDIYPLPGTIWRIPKTMSKLVNTINGLQYEHCNDKDHMCLKGEQSHDAGYDSLMTTVIFIMQFNRILKHKDISWNQAMDPRGDKKKSPILRTLDNVKNLIRLVKSQPNFINLGNTKDEEMSRYFFMSGFPNSWKKWDITKIWSPLWVSISWIDETSCWIIVKNDEDIRNINLIYRMMKNPQFTLMTYDSYKQMHKTK
ncbi:bifunctional Nucleotide-binding alpha-beta plait domain superfamily/Ribonuclease H superfamily/R3H domain superfamily/R3H domain/Poly(A)-specific ribonuclease [Babesia duncani]|uniref:Poly(A)-specific ribonuclease PARN n=1 Tax=Babesia duncani TaxID=323732 RepID=A0AAD9UN69_9APIC|nr:bifunctional Nucleotide-binding alpha-beta plait domain superfamily/Ribonuclease H superfamily/R3H domain superfamily/R3H domain/Poly(A)-specific ribonuclease [Babesia duncani]